jgi:CheY-like chemotaxis protein
LATMSHELRTPLNAILGWASLLRRGARDADGLERGLATIERNALAQARLIEDVLDVSRIISGKLRLDVRRVDLVAIANAAADVVRPAAVARRVRLSVDAGPESKVELVGDPDRLQQVIWNLLSNAVKFTPGDGAVMLSIDRQGSALRLVVSDTGAGIAPEHLPFVFERFRQVDSSTTRKYGGLGLGLAIVRHLVELHGGTVFAESAGPGRGATFTVDLPVRALDSQPPETAAFGVVERAAEPSSASRRLLGVKVLVIDDDEDSRLLLQTALEGVGAWVRLADSAATAFSFLEQQRVDVVISDIGMPEEDGISLIRRLRAVPVHQCLPAVALTAYARSEDVTRALEAGFQRHLAKPANIAELAQIVAELVERTALGGA